MPRVGDGSALEAVELAKRAEKPWLYVQDADAHADPGDGRTLGDVQSDRSRRVIGVPLAVKIGLTIGAARRRDELAAAAAHARAAFDHGLVDGDVYKALTDAVTATEGNLAWHRGWWQRAAPAARIVRRSQEAIRRPNIQHRRRLAAAGPMPPELARHLTTAQLAVHKTIADEVWRCGTCRISKKEISDRAKTCETVVHQAIRKAIALGLMHVKLRPMPGRKSLPNLITIIDRDWLRWIYHPKYRMRRADREIEEEARQKVQRGQGAHRCTPYPEHIYQRGDDGVWRDQEVAEGWRWRSPALPPPTLISKPAGCGS
jgi:hypothetical protein